MHPLTRQAIRQAIVSLTAHLASREGRATSFHEIKEESLNFTLMKHDLLKAANSRVSIWDAGAALDDSVRVWVPETNI
jgi:hypothetical protein